MIESLTNTGIWTNPELIDIVILCVMLLSFALGMITGFIWQIAGMISIGLGLLAAWFLTTPVAGFFKTFTDSQTTAFLAARIALFCGVAIIIRLLAAFLKAVLEKMKLGHYDRLLGGFLGAAKALVLCAVMLAILSQVPGNLRENIKISVIGGLSTATADWIIGNPCTISPEEAIQEAMNKIISRLSGIKGSLSQSSNSDKKRVVQETAENATR